MVRATEKPPLPVRPARWWPLVMWLIAWSLLAYFVDVDHPGGFVNWYTTVIWTIPFGIAVIGALGAVVSRKAIKAQATKKLVESIDDPLDVVLTTRGTADVIGALTRVIRSMTHFADHFANVTVYIVTEEGAAALAQINELVTEIGATVLIVPTSYQTARGTQFKARAAQFALEQRVAGMGGSDNIPTNHHTYHLDDDTSVCDDTVRGIARFIIDNRGPDGKFLAQGILAYKRKHSKSMWMWLADAIRTADDLLRFPLTTGRGFPRAGLHGENLIVRTFCLVEITWDFGPGEIVEDSRFAQEFCKRYPGKSAWGSFRCYGATPISPWEFVSQRRRWSEGMNGLAANRTIPFKERLLIIHNMVIWSTGITQPVAVVAFISWIVSDYNVAPVTPWIAPFWVLSVSYTCWAYYEGLWANANASGWKHPKLYHIVLMFPGILLFSLMEGAGGTLGALRHFSGRTPTFDMIKKPV
jgi:egghead protein (zeste-white 4 protein)